MGEEQQKQNFASQPKQLIGKLNEGSVICCVTTAILAFHHTLVPLPNQALVNVPIMWAKHGEARRDFGGDVGQA